MDTTASNKPEFSKLDQEINTDRLIHMPDNASLSKQKRVAQHRVLSLAPRRVAVVGPSRECACLADDADPSSCRSRAQPRPQSGTASQCSTVWVCSRVESRLARCILVWDVISLSCASLALSYESKSPGLVGPDPDTGPGHNLARPSHPNYTVRVGPAPRPPALATPRRTRVAGIGGESGGAERRRPVCRLQPWQPAQCPGCPARAGPAGRPEHHRGRMGPRYLPSLSERPGLRPVRCLH